VALALLVVTGVFTFYQEQLARDESHRDMRQVLDQAGSERDRVTFNKA
jgi:hypothetical protein